MRVIHHFFICDEMVVKVSGKFCLNCFKIFLGSIIVNFELVASDDVTAAQLNEAYQDLVTFLERGLLRLVRP